MNRFSLSLSGFLAPTLSSLSLCLALTGVAGAQPTLPTLPSPPTPDTPTPIPTSAPLTAATSQRTAPLSIDPNAILINIDGRGIASDPPPLLNKGRTFVPLRGVLENLGARVNYIAAERRVDIARGPQNVTLFLGTTRATIDGREVEVEKPLLVDNRAFVPLRAVAELFGLRVAWLAPTRTVAIYTGAPITKAVDHRAELRATAPFGITIDFAAQPLEAVPALLDDAKAAGASLVKFRFDWGTLEPAKGAAFEWPAYDAIVREARARDLKIVGILGDTAPWASVATSTYGSDQRQSPPRDAELPAWSNYVSRTVGRYGNDVSAWQVWENPNSTNFRSISRNYRKLARLAVDAAHEANAKTIVYVSEPGGVDLDAVRGYNQNGLTAVADGVAVFPVSQFQPNALAAPEAFLRPYARLRESLQLSDGKTRDYWVGGLSFPVALPFPGAPQNDDGKNSLRVLTPLAQADYLVKSMALSLAAGGEKVFWDHLRDVPTPRMLAALQSAPPLLASGSPAVTPLETEKPAEGTLTTGVAALTAKVTAPREGVVSDDGLQRADGTSRPSYAAFKMMATNLGDKPYRGNLSFNSNLVALLFDNTQSGALVVWSPAGEATLALNSSGATVELPGAQFIATRPDSQVLDATGTSVAMTDGVLKIGARPILITNVASASVQAALANPATATLQLKDPTPYQNATSVSAQLTPDGDEKGIFWRKYASFGSVASEFSERDGRKGLTTQPQRDIFDLKSQKPFLYFDVADDFLYDAPGVPLVLTVEVYAPPLSDESKALGFRVEYDSTNGVKSLLWQPLKPGSGWQKFEIPLPDAQFSNTGGYDFLINVGASAAPLTFASVAIAPAAKTPVVPLAP